MGAMAVDHIEAGQVMLASGTTWLPARSWPVSKFTHEMAIGYTNDVGYIGRLLLAHDGTWPIHGDATAELTHKLAESLWWTFVLANKFNIDIDEAFTATMTTIRANLKATMERTAPSGNISASQALALT